MDDPLTHILDTVPPSQLMQLPAELRLQIYGYVWPKGTTRIKILFGVNGTIVRDGSIRQDGGDETALLKTCRKVYCEGLSVMYGSITFALHSVCRDVEAIDGDKVLDFLCPWLEHAQHLEIGFWALGIPNPNMGLFYLLGNLIWRFESEKLKRAELVKVGIYGSHLRYGTREFDVDLGWVMGTLVGLKLRGRTVVQLLLKLGFYDDIEYASLQSQADLALVMSRLVKANFQGHPVVVVRNCPGREAAERKIGKYLRSLAEGGRLVRYCRHSVVKDKRL
ncbi:hypothetical protein LTS10_000558 [Elasticomyces elasticus]|nr:hypothetical protein LTS10_000558 [Elasticomyces elasticus]